MPTEPTQPDPVREDPVMEAIGRAVARGRAGEHTAAREELLELWAGTGVTGDPLHRCSLAHYLADLHEDAAQALAWDVRALDAADAVTEQRVQEHHSDLHIAGFYPSLHLNLADNYRRLGSFAAAAEHITAAAEHAPGLPPGAYGDLIRDAVREVTEAIARRDVTRRASAPSPSS
ncbi:hypothetical protein AB0M42_14745 [Streptomyces sp. NPDC051784]|uniref:hypothetical protein n=1 Tax=Streptomyces sp. NPDC051784 TaxID=3155805 RepID=UPI00341EBD2A